MTLPGYRALPWKDSGREDCKEALKDQQGQEPSSKVPALGLMPEYLHPNQTA